MLASSLRRLRRGGVCVVHHHPGTGSRQFSSQAAWLARFEVLQRAPAPIETKRALLRDMMPVNMRVDQAEDAFKALFVESESVPDVLAQNLMLQFYHAQIREHPVENASLLLNQLILLKELVDDPDVVPTIESFHAVVATTADRLLVDDTVDVLQSLKHSFDKASSPTDRAHLTPTLKFALDVVVPFVHAHKSDAALRLLGIISDIFPRLARTEDAQAALARFYRSIPRSISNEELTSVHDKLVSMGLSENAVTLTHLLRVHSARRDLGSSTRVLEKLQSAGTVTGANFHDMIMAYAPSRDAQREGASVKDHTTDVGGVTSYMEARKIFRHIKASNLPVTSSHFCALLSSFGRSFSLHDLAHLLSEAMQLKLPLLSMLPLVTRECRPLLRSPEGLELSNLIFQRTLIRCKDADELRKEAERELKQMLPVSRRRYLPRHDFPQFMLHRNDFDNLSGEESAMLDGVVSRLLESFCGALIISFSQTARLEGVFGVLDQMKRLNVEPSENIFQLVMDHLAQRLVRSGNTDGFLQLLERMKGYSIEPTPELILHACEVMCESKTEGVLTNVPHVLLRLSDIEPAQGDVIVTITSEIFEQLLKTVASRERVLVTDNDGVQTLIELSAELGLRLTQRARLYAAKVFARLGDAKELENVLASGAFSTSQTQYIADTVLRIPTTPLRLRCADALLRSLHLELPADEAERERALNSLSVPDALNAGIYAALIRIYGSVARLSRPKEAGVGSVSESEGVDSTSSSSRTAHDESVSTQDHLRWKMLHDNEPYPEPERRREQATKAIYDLATIFAKAPANLDHIQSSPKDAQLVAHELLHAACELKDALVGSVAFDTLKRREDNTAGKQYVAGTTYRLMIACAALCGDRAMAEDMTTKMKAAGFSSNLIPEMIDRLMPTSSTVSPTAPQNSDLSHDELLKYLKSVRHEQRWVDSPSHQVIFALNVLERNDHVVDLARYVAGSDAPDLAVKIITGTLLTQGKLDTARGFISYMRRTEHVVPKDYVVKALLRACEKRDVWHAEAFWRLHQRCFGALPSDAGCRAFLRTLASRGDAARVCTAVKELVEGGRSPSETYLKSVADGFVESRDLSSCREAFASLAELLEESASDGGGESVGEPALATISQRYGEWAEHAIEGKWRVRSPASLSRRGDGTQRQRKRRSQKSFT